MLKNHRGKYKMYLSENGIKQRKESQIRLKYALENDVAEPCTEPGCNCMTEPAEIYWQPVFNPENNAESGMYLYMTKRSLNDEYFFDVSAQSKYILIDAQDIPTDEELSEFMDGLN